jgi:hypothetical protein
MTQAFNLSQFANNVNTSGQASLTAAVSGTLPVANGGTGTATPSLVGGTNITISGSFPNQTITASGGGVTSLNGQTGAITNTNLYAIGSYVTGRTQNTTAYTVNSTLAGSSLYATSPEIFWSSTNSQWRPAGSTSDVSASITLVNTGTWRCVSPAPVAGSTSAYTGLWVRIS